MYKDLKYKWSHSISNQNVQSCTLCFISTWAEVYFPIICFDGDKVEQVPSSL